MIALGDHVGNHVLAAAAYCFQPFSNFLQGRYRQPFSAAACRNRLKQGTHMRIIRETALPVPPRASAIPQAHPTLTTKQIIRIARSFDSATEGDLTQARTAWKKYQSTRRRDAVYGYLGVVAKIVRRWKKQHCAKAKSRQALRATGHRTTIRSLESFAVVIFCTSDSDKVDAKTRSKWSRALRCAEQLKPDIQSLEQFIKGRGGINECAGEW